MTQIEKVERSLPQTILELANEVVEGNISAAQLHLFLRQVKEALEFAEKSIKPTLLREADCPEGISMNGYNIKVRSGAGRHSYDHIPTWVELKGKMSDIEEKAKLANKMYLRGDQYVTEDGELIPPSVYVSYEDSVVVTKIKGGL